MLILANTFIRVKMSIQPDIENILIQLDYGVNEAYENQLKEIVNNTNGFFDFAKHIFTLNDELKRLNAIVAMSNSNSYLKIKSNSTDPLKIEEFNEVVKKWASKYKLELKKVENKNTYYILGKKS